MLKNTVNRPKITRVNLKNKRINLFNQSELTTREVELSVPSKPDESSQNIELQIHAKQCESNQNTDQPISNKVKAVEIVNQAEFTKSLPIVNKCFYCFSV